LSHLCLYALLIVLQSHFEDSQFEMNRQDGKRLLKWNAIPTLFDVPNKPKPVTIRRVNPLSRKRVVAATSAASDSGASMPSIKRPRTTDHQYCQTETTPNHMVFQTCAALPSCDHAYSVGICYGNSAIHVYYVVLVVQIVS
jgi:hypothetical protein